MRVLVDTNIILDFLLEREPFLHDAEVLFQAIGSGHLELALASNTSDFEDALQIACAVV